MSIHDQPIYNSDQYDLLIHDLKEAGVEAVSVTNGAFNFSGGDIIAQTPRTLIGGFQFIAESIGNMNLKQAFLIAVHGATSMERDYGVDPSTIIPAERRAEIFLPQMRQHFSALGIPVAAVVFDDISAVPMEDAIYESGIELDTAFKFGPWGNEPGKFCVFHKCFETVASFPYPDANKKPFMLNQGPWDGNGTDPRDMFRLQEGVAFYHKATDLKDRQTRHLEVRDLYTERNSTCNTYLTANHYPTFPLNNGLKLV